MITVLLFTEENRNTLRGTYNEQVLEPVIDGLGRYIVGLEVLTNEAFASIYEQLNSLERVEYVEPINEDLI